MCHRDPYLVLSDIDGSNFGSQFIRGHLIDARLLKYTLATGAAKEDSDGACERWESVLELTEVVV
jgi:hypothetical protein